MSVIRNSEVVRYSVVANVLIVYKNKLVHCMLSVIRRLSAIAWECPLIEILLYTIYIYGIRNLMCMCVEIASFFPHLHSLDAY